LARTDVGSKLTVVCQIRGCLACQTLKDQDVMEFVFLQCTLAWQWSTCLEYCVMRPFTTDQANSLNG